MGHPDHIPAAFRPPLSPGATFASVSLALAALFVAAPGIDLWVAGWFYVPGMGFVGTGPGLARAGEVAIDLLRWLAIVLPLLILARWAIHGPLPPWAPAGIAARFFATLVLGPGLLVNLILKDQWGRPRPGQIVEFGGSLDFQPAFMMSDACARNCSFVAGHPSFVFAFYAVALALPNRAARLGTTIGVTAVGALVGIGRMSQGAHFLSDVLFAGIFVFAVAWLVDRATDRLPPVTPLDLRHQLRRLRLLLRVFLARFPRLVAWQQREVGPAGRRLLALAALGLLVALCLGWLDIALAVWLKRHDASELTAFFRFVTWFGKSWPYYLAFGAVGIAFAWFAAQATEPGRRERLRRVCHRAAFLFWSLAAAGLAAQILKFVLGRARPRVFFGERSYGLAPFELSVDWTSMPSGHTITAVAIGLAATMLWRPLWPVALLFALLIGLSRIVTTVHFASDVIVGALVAIVAVAIVRRCFEAAGAEIFDDRFTWGRKR